MKQLRDGELLALQKKHGNLLKPEQVVEYARNPKTALHSAFEWDDGKAAHEYRLWQAQHLIAEVEIIEPKSKKPVRAFVSLYSDREKPGGGYRETVAVLSDADMRAQLLSQAWREFKYWQSKYEHLAELAPIIAAAARLQSKLGKPRKKAS